VNRPTFIGYDQIFGFRWPSVFYAIDIVAWDVFFAFAVLFAVPAFAPRSKTSLIRWGLITSGTLSLVGLIGPLVAIWRGERSASWVTPSGRRVAPGRQARGGTAVRRSERAARPAKGRVTVRRRLPPFRQLSAKQVVV
jgi:hypothetical protein